jgi:hypothetical protein
MKTPSETDVTEQPERVARGSLRRMVSLLVNRPFLQLSIILMAGAYLTPSGVPGGLELALASFIAAVLDTETRKQANAPHELPPTKTL